MSRAPAVDVLVRRGVPVAMRDGTVLRADVLLPAGDDRPRPALLHRTPYDRAAVEGTVLSLGIDLHRAVDRGFAVVIQDVRGCFGSDGAFAPFAQEGDDGEDTIAWVATQPWCDGDVAMWGPSYTGATQLLAAVRAPPALRALAPSVTGDDVHDGWTHRGGAEQRGFLVWWVLRGLAAGSLTRLRERDPAAAARLARLFDRFADDPLAALHGDQAAFGAAVAELSPYLAQWRAHPTRDDWWRAVSIRDRSERIAVPALHVAGWFDLFLPGTLANFARLRAGAATAAARAGQRLVVGPWTHGVRGEAVGELLLGRRAAFAWLDPTALQLDFFAAVLRGEPPPGPPVRLWTVGADRWREEEAWPPARMRERPWFLAGAEAGGSGAAALPAAAAVRGGAGAPAPDGRFGPAPPPVAAPPSRFLHDPAALVPTVAGATMGPGADLCFASGPRDRRAVQARADVLTFTSAPLTRATELTGPLRAVLWVAAPAPDWDVVVALSWLAPDGRALHLSDGIRRISFRDGPAGGAPAPPRGAPVRVEVELDATSIALASGTRLRVEVCGSCFPRFGPHPEVREPLPVTLFHDAARPSQVLLPVA